MKQVKLSSRWNHRHCITPSHVHGKPTNKGGQLFINKDFRRENKYDLKLQGLLYVMSVQTYKDFNGIKQKE